MSMVTYWKDNLSGTVIKMETEFDAKEMAKHPEYTKVSEKEYKQQRQTEELAKE